MSGASNDFKAAFRAAKSARDGGKLTKAQLRAMKAQKAAALCQQAEEAAADRTRSCEEDARSMPPPPPRLSATAKQAQASYHADSQATRMGEGATGALQSEPSVNDRGARAPRTSPDAVNNAASAAGCTGLPAGFFEASVGDGDGAVLSGGGSARSAEGSTGGLEGGRGASNAADLATSALSPPPKQGSAAAASAAVLSGIHDEEEGAETWGGTGLPDVGSAPTAHAEESAAGAAAPAGSAKAALPAGFFSDAAADAKARGVAPKKKKAAELEKELADFMNEVETDAAAAAAATAAADEDDSAVRRDRDDFEHFVRMERLRELKEAAAKRGATAEAADDAAPLASALELAGIQPEAPPPPVLRLPKRRKIGETLAQLESGGDGDSDGSSGSDGEEALVDWRAKQSTR